MRSTFKCGVKCRICASMIYELMFNFIVFARKSGKPLRRFSIQAMKTFLVKCRICASMKKFTPSQYKGICRIIT